MDDFGTGYSSLSHLSQFPFDELKVDRSFVVNLPGQGAEVAIVRSVVELGHRLGLSVCAEGVETTEQLACLKQLDCDSYQGFLFGEAIPSAEFQELLATEKSR
jgi:EAL domain-containing protein (putative c-di-GMP-specific phosphodiesterase class I)